MKSSMLLALAACLAPCAAGAQSVLTQNVLFGPALTDFSSAKGVTTNGALLPFFFFDTRVGTLNSITFSSSYQFASAINVINSSATQATGSVRTQSAAQFSSDDSGVTQALNRAVNSLVDPIDGKAFTAGNTTLTPIAYDLRGTSSTYNLAPGTSSIYASAGMASFTFTDSDAADLAAFSRVGTFSYNPLFSTLTALVLNSTGGNVGATDTTTASGSLTISYNITPLATGGVSAAPEPGTWGMMILGFGLAGAALRRRRSSTRTPLAA